MKIGSTGLALASSSILRRTAAFLLGSFFAFAPLDLPASITEIAVPGAQRAVERYDDAVAKAQAAYREAEKRASERWDERAFLQRATSTYDASMKKATKELVSELEQIEGWLTGQVEQISERRKTAAAKLEEALAAPFYGRLHMVVKGRGDVFLNGSILADMSSSNDVYLTSTDIRLRHGDLLVFRVQSPFVYRSFRAIVVGEDGTHIPITTINGIRFIGDGEPETMTSELFEQDWPRANLGRAEGGMKEAWEGLRLQADETLWIALPDRGTPYHYAFLVP